MDFRMQKQLSTFIQLQKHASNVAPLVSSILKDHKMDLNVLSTYYMTLELIKIYSWIERIFGAVMSLVSEVSNGKPSKNEMKYLSFT